MYLEQHSSLCEALLPMDENLAKERHALLQQVMAVAFHAGLFLTLRGKTSFASRKCYSEFFPRCDCSGFHEPSLNAGTSRIVLDCALPFFLRSLTIPTQNFGGFWHWVKKIRWQEAQPSQDPASMLAFGTSSTPTPLVLAYKDFKTWRMGILETFF